MSKISKFKVILGVSFLTATLTIILSVFLPMTTASLKTSPDVPSPQSSSFSNNAETSKTQEQISLKTSVSSLSPIHVSDPQALNLYDKGLDLYYQRQFSRALELFNKALVIDPKCYEALNGKGAALAFQGNYDQGLALIEQALDLNPAYVYGNFNRGLAYELAGNWDAAINAYRHTLQLDQRDTWSYYGIASIYGRLGDIDKVLEYLRPAIALNPDVKEVAREEKDFTPVRENPRFQALIAP